MSLSHAQEEWRGEVIHLSWSPRAFLLKGFLTDEECDHIIEKVRHACMHAVQAAAWAWQWMAWLCALADVDTLTPPSAACSAHLAQHTTS